MCVFFKGYGDHRDLLSFPTRRSSDLSRPPTRLNSCESHAGRASRRLTARGASMVAAARWDAPAYARPLPPRSLDRKSTRLNSSHANISYAVFCLKKNDCGILLLLGPI